MVQPPSMWAGDWPTYRGDNARSGFRSFGPPSTLELAWEFSPLQSPQPAWPPPARGSYWQKLSYVAPRIVDDRTFHPVVSGGRVLLASSADDSLYCLDLATGQQLWRETTGGPIRYAPSVADDKVYIASDDGFAYCYELQQGKMVWRRQLAASNRVIPGNGRLISPWPARTGVAVEQGVAYTTAGLYPSQGVFVYALDAKTGSVIWRSQIDYTAHGYLLVTDKFLVIPTGRSTPVLVRKADGSVAGQVDGAPGSYAVVAGNEVLSGRGNDGALTASGMDQNQSLVKFRAEQICAGTQVSYLLDKSRLTALRLSNFVDLSRRMAANQALLEKAIARKRAAEEGGANSNAIQKITTRIDELAQAIGALDKQRAACRLWEVDAAKVGCIAACEEFVVIGGQGGIELRSPADGSLLHKRHIDGQVLGLAFTDEALIAATDAGQVLCFAKAQTEEVSPITNSPAPASNAQNAWDEPIRALVDESLTPTFASTKGYALVLGAGDQRLVESLAANTDYSIVAVDTDAERVDALRQRFLRSGTYGGRVAALRTSSEQLPFADYIFSLVVSSQALDTPGKPAKPQPVWPQTEIDRVTRPFGGVAWTAPAGPQKRGPLPGAGSWAHQYGNTSNTANSGDAHLSRPLRLQWFGGPGPARMVDRHLRAPAPLVSGGRTFVSGENSIVCIDSYSGTEYWQLDAPGSQRYSMPYDCGYSCIDSTHLLLASGDQLWMIDAASGEIDQKVKVPPARKGADFHWGYVAAANEQLFGTSQLATASRTEPSRAQIDVDYSNEQPIVTSQSIFALRKESQQPLWTFDAAILNPTITLAGEVLYFVASQQDAMRGHATGRIPLDEFLQHAPHVYALDASTGEQLWRAPLPKHLLNCKNILYLQKAPERLILSGSRLHASDSWYRIAALDPKSGKTLWEAEHAKGKAGAHTHGEQLHHPVILGNTLVCEPILYDLATGDRMAPPGEAHDWSIQRPGHSCGTMSGAGQCLLFRANNPTLLDLGVGPRGSDRFFTISPTRPGCWINIVAADGLVLIPEASASCVCHYSLQTSMAFQAVPNQQAAAE